MRVRAEKPVAGTSGVLSGARTTATDSVLTGNAAGRA
jgi:hypothetical protein